MTAGPLHRDLVGDAGDNGHEHDARHNDEHELRQPVGHSETGDDGRQLWDELSHESWASSTPIIAICKEGNLTQIRNAILSDLINDLIFEPIDVESIKRRIKKHQTL